MPVGSGESVQGSARVEGFVAPVPQLFQGADGFGIGTGSQLNDEVCIVGGADSAAS